MKITNQRNIIIDILIKSQHKLISASLLYEKVKKEDKSINLTTIYRNIEMLIDLGALYKINLNDKESVYKMICNESHHHHLICIKCGQTDCLDYCPMDNNIKTKISKKQFKMIEHNFEVLGYCRDCS